MYSYSRYLLLKNNEFERNKLEDGLEKALQKVEKYNLTTDEKGKIFDKILMKPVKDIEIITDVKTYEKYIVLSTKEKIEIDGKYNQLINKKYIFNNQLDVGSLGKIFSYLNPVSYIFRDPRPSVSTNPNTGGVGDTYNTPNNAGYIGLLKSSLANVFYRTQIETKPKILENLNNAKKKKEDPYKIKGKSGTKNQSIFNIVVKSIFDESRELPGIFSSQIVQDMSMLITNKMYTELSIFGKVAVPVITLIPGASTFFLSFILPTSFSSMIQRFSFQGIVICVFVVESTLKLFKWMLTSVFRKNDGKDKKKNAINDTEEDQFKELTNRLDKLIEVQSLQIKENNMKSDDLKNLLVKSKKSLEDKRLYPYAKILDNFIDLKDQLENLCIHLNNNYIEYTTEYIRNKKYKKKQPSNSSTIYTASRTVNEAILKKFIPISYDDKGEETNKKNIDIEQNYKDPLLNIKLTRTDSRIIKNGWKKYVFDEILDKLPILFLIYKYKNLKMIFFTINALLKNRIFDDKYYNLSRSDLKLGVRPENEIFNSDLFKTPKSRDRVYNIKKMIKRRNKNLTEDFAKLNRKVVLLELENNGYNAKKYLSEEILDPKINEILFGKKDSEDIKIGKKGLLKSFTNDIKDSTMNLFKFLGRKGMSATRKTAEALRVVSRRKFDDNITQLDLENDIKLFNEYIEKYLNAFTSKIANKDFFKNEGKNEKIKDFKQKLLILGRYSFNNVYYAMANRLIHNLYLLFNSLILSNETKKKESNDIVKKYFTEAFEGDGNNDYSVFNDVVLKYADQINDTHLQRMRTLKKNLKQIRNLMKNLNILCYTGINDIESSSKHEIINHIIRFETAINILIAGKKKLTNRREDLKDDEISTNYFINTSKLLNFDLPGLFRVYLSQNINDMKKIKEIEKEIKNKKTQEINGIDSITMTYFSKIAIEKMKNPLYDSLVQIIKDNSLELNYKNTFKMKYFLELYKHNIDVEYKNLESAIKFKDEMYDIKDKNKKNIDEMIKQLKDFFQILIKGLLDKSENIKSLQIIKNIFFKGEEWKSKEEMIKHILNNIKNRYLSIIFKKISK